VSRFTGRRCDLGRALLRPILTRRFGAKLHNRAADVDGNRGLDMKGEARAALEFFAVASVFCSLLALLSAFSW
jgi:hypothetical protein